MRPVTDRNGQAPLLVCFSHLRWNFVFQRPQHLMSRAARDFDVLFVEEPVYEPVLRPEMQLRREQSGIEIATPTLPDDGMDPAPTIRKLLDRHLADRGSLIVSWYYTPMAIDFSYHLTPRVTVYDCMDELSGFLNPPPRLLEREEGLFARADVVFTGGRSLYEAKRDRHGAVFLFPSSVDAAHFLAARKKRADPGDQANISRPRIGFFGVIDERMDLELVARAARECPEIQFVMLGPVVKIEPAALPRAPNLHWLGRREYDALPEYAAGWDAAWMPFALNEATRFISPTKTPEFLAAGLPVTSTPIADVVHDYGANGLVNIVQPDGDIADALRASLSVRSPAWLDRVDSALSDRSWDRIWAEMFEIVRSAESRQPQAKRRKLQ